MKEHAMLFNAPMALATLDRRKTQTRRIITAHNSLVDGNGLGKKRWEEMALDLANAWIDNGPSPAGNSGPYLKATSASEGTTHRLYPRIKAGDHIWGKETWRPAISHSCGMDTCDCDDVAVTYAADGMQWLFTWNSHPQPANDWLMPKAAEKGNVSPLFMPRWAARILLEVVSVRPKRLKDISERDALQEGVGLVLADNWPDPKAMSDAVARSRRAGFRLLWESINGPESWDANPWVWVIEFKQVEQSQ